MQQFTSKRAFSVVDATARPVLASSFPALRASQFSTARRRVVGCQARFNDPFKTLGIPATATDKQIKSAYRKLALRHHPDIDPSDEAHARFIAIQEAYELVTGKRRGKESMGSASAGDWDFHDWYWSFKAQRKQRGGQQNTQKAQAQTRSAEPQVNQQLAGLKQRAGKRSKRASYKGAAASPQPSTQAATTNTAAAKRTVQQQTATKQPTVFATAAQPKTVEAMPLHFVSEEGPAVAEGPQEGPAGVLEGGPSMPRAPVHHMHTLLQHIGNSHRHLAQELSMHFAAAVSHVMAQESRNSGLLWPMEVHFRQFPPSRIPVKPFLVQLKVVLTIRLREGFTGLAQRISHHQQHSDDSVDSPDGPVVRPFQRQYSFSSVSAGDSAQFGGFSHGFEGHSFDEEQPAAKEHAYAHESRPKPNVGTEEHRSRVASQLTGLRRKAALNRDP